MSLDRPTYRYAVAIVGIGYAMYDLGDQAHFMLAESLWDAEQIIRACAAGRPRRTDENAAGYHNLPATPNYGNPEDYADIFEIDRKHPEFSEVLDEPGARAQHAWWYMKDTPKYQIAFGPRGGLIRYTC